MLAFLFKIIVAYKEKRWVFLVVEYRIARWMQVPGCKQVVLFNVCLLPGRQLLLHAVFDWSLCARHSRDGVGCLHLS